MHVSAKTGLCKQDCYGS